MKWTAVEPSGNMTARESVLTSIGSFRTRPLGKPIEETEQMTAVQFGWCGLPRVTRVSALSQ